ncbi:MAG: hypothetical protein R3D66_06870 [Alphaproteobacteria bacterium]
MPREDDVWDIGAQNFVSDLHQGGRQRNGLADQLILGRWAVLPLDTLEQQGGTAKDSIGGKTLQ